MPFSTARRIEQASRLCLESHQLANRDALLVVASSGGPDSQALLHALVALRDDLRLRLHVAHLNHDFRGEEADKDARFVASEAARLSLSATVEKIDPISYQRQHGISSFEAAAREIRYGFLARVMQETNAEAVVLGHTADDQAETVLMHIIRGAGLQGLKGMEPLSVWRHPRKDIQVALLRPLLDVSKAETEAYCVERGIPYRIDTSNKSLRFTRNRVRWKLMPVLRSFNPRVRESLCRLSRAASEQVSLLEQKADDAWRQVARESAGQSVALAVAVMTALPPLLQAHLLRRAYQSVSGALTALEEVHVQAMVEMLASPPGRTLHLPRGVRMHVGYRELVISKGDTPPPLPLLEGEYILNVPGETRIPGWVVRTELLERPPGVLPDGISTACFDFEALGGKLVVRVVRRGDRFQPLGMEGTRKLHDLFVDEKVPRDWRARVPLVVSERGTAWVVGYRTAHWARVVRDTSATVRVSFAQPK